MLDVGAWCSPCPECTDLPAMLFLAVSVANGLGNVPTATVPKDWGVTNMLVSRLAILAAIAACVCAGKASAQSTAPAATNQVSFDYYYSEASAPYGVQAPVAQAPAAAAGCQTSCDSGCNAGCNSCNSCCDSCCGWGWPCGGLLECLGEPCRLWEPCCECDTFKAGGWLAASYTYNPYQPTDNFNGPLTWTDRANEFQMNELYFFAGRAADNGGCGLDFGWRTDMMYGTNYRWNTSSGFESNWETNQEFYGVAVPQLYGEVAYNDLTVKVGRFFSPVGYYVIGTANNFFPVLPYTFQYGEPFTHTGALGSYKYSDSLTLGGGVTYGWDNSDNFQNPHAGGLATATYAIDDCRTLAYVGVFGVEPTFNAGDAFSNRYLQTVVYTNKLSDDVQWVLQSDYGVQDDMFVDGDDAKWYGVNTYLYWNMTCRCQWGLNGEWFRDQGGSRVGQVLPSNGSPRARGFDQGRGPSTAGGPGFDGSFYRLTFGPKYYFTPNVYGRTAVVADYYSGARDTDTVELPFDDGTQRYQQVLVFDLIATF
jgi:hypothetical protein